MRSHTHRHSMTPSVRLSMKSPSGKVFPVTASIHACACCASFWYSAFNSSMVGQSKAYKSGSGTSRVQHAQELAQRDTRIHSRPRYTGGTGCRQGWGGQTAVQNAGTSTNAPNNPKIRLCFDGKLSATKKIARTLQGAAHPPHTPRCCRPKFSQHNHHKLLRAHGHCAPGDRARREAWSRMVLKRQLPKRRPCQMPRLMLLSL